MFEPRLIDTRDLPLDAIDAGDRLRPVSAASVEALAASLRDVGLLHPVTVRRLPATDAGERCALIGGAHRLAAARRLGWETIRASVYQCRVDVAQLMEVEENLQSAELGTLDLALHLQRQRELYQSLYPQSVRGRAGAEAKYRNLQVSHETLAEVLAAKRGVKPRQILRYMEVGARLDAEAVETLRRLTVEPSLRELKAISGLEVADQRTVAAYWAAGGATSGAEAIERALDRKKLALQTADDKAAKRIRDAWHQASHAARARAVADINGIAQKTVLVFVPEGAE